MYIMPYILVICAFSTFIVSGIHLAEDLPETKEAQSLHPSKFKVYFNEFSTENGKVNLYKNHVHPNNITKFQHFVFNILFKYYLFSLVHGMPF